MNEPPRFCRKTATRTTINIILFIFLTKKTRFLEQLFFFLNLKKIQKSFKHLEAFGTVIINYLQFKSRRLNITLKNF